MKGSLSDLFILERKGQVPLEWNNTKKLIMIFGIAYVMLYSYSYKILHHDLKPENILFNEYLHPKICDYHLISGNLQQSIAFVSAKHEHGKIMYMSLDLLDNDTYYEESDVYSFSMIFYEIVTGNTPFEVKSLAHFLTKIMQGEKHKFDSQIPACLKDLISKCWDQNYKNHPSFSTIVDYLKKTEIYSEFLHYDEEQEKEYLEYIKNVENCSEKKIFKHSFVKVNIDFDLKESAESNEEISNKFDYQLIDLTNIVPKMTKKNQNLFLRKIFNSIIEEKFSY